VVRQRHSATGRTAVECTRDRLADAIGQDIAAVARSAVDTPGAQVIDPFAGSGNTLYWILRHLPHSRGTGFESNPQIFQLTQQNLSRLGLPLEFLHADYVTALQTLVAPPDQS